MTAGLCLGIVLCLLLIVPVEWERVTASGGLAWLFDFNVDTTLYAVLFLLLPVCWLVRTPVLAAPPRWLIRLGRSLAERPGSSPPGAHAWLWVALVGTVAAAGWLRVAATTVGGPDGFAFGSLPPALHDEFSYRFQARTFLAGRLAFDSAPDLPHLFDQMHVWNEGRFASRYFPGTGLWITPFLAFGLPLAGHCVATVLICMLVFAVGRELACTGVGVVAGLLAAVSPGLPLFGNLLLAHQPTLVGLGVFMLAFLRMQRHLNSDAAIVAESASRRAVRWSLVSGAGLAFAMLCRPMTAAGAGLPFGIWLAVWLCRHGMTSPRRATYIVAGFALPLAAGGTFLLICNQAITGNALRTPYQAYTELYTPRHMYGFNNAQRAERFQNPRVIANYDQWAENLDAALAVRNVRNRLIASGQWTVGPVPLILATALLAAGGWRNVDSRSWLPVAAIGSLHLLHVPYWYEGILQWHYVFETNVLWCLVAGLATWLLIRLAGQSGRPWLPVWWMAVLLAAVLVNQVAVPPLWGQSRLEAGVGQFAFARLNYAMFQDMIERLVTDRPALVLVRHDPTDRHIDYVDNTPDLNGLVLIGRWPIEAAPAVPATLEDVRRAFPERSVYLFDVKERVLHRLAVSSAPAVSKPPLPHRSGTPGP